MTTHGEGAKDEMHSFYPPLPSTTYFISWPFCDRAIHSLPCNTLFLSDTHYTYAPSLFSSLTHTDQPKHVILPAGNLYRFQNEKATTAQSGQQGLHRSCAQAALYGCTVVRPLVHTPPQSHDTHGELQQGSYVYTPKTKRPLYLVFLCINEWTDTGIRILSMETAGYLSWLSNLFIPSGAITYHGSKLNSLSLVSSTST